MTSQNQALAGSHPKPVAQTRLGLALAVIVTGELVLILDTTIVNVALPSIQRDLAFSATGIAWVVDAFALAFGGLLLLGGRTGDILGRRFVFVIGLVIFAVSSLLGGFAVSDVWLVAARIGQGIGAAIAGPSTLALLTTNFKVGAERNRALAVYSAVTGSGMAIGLIVGGALTALMSWRFVMFVNVPIALLAAVLAPRFVRESERSPGRFDIVGAVLSTAGMTGLVFGLLQAASAGWFNITTVASLSAGVLLIVAFLATERRARQPIMPLGLFAHRNRASGYAIMFLFGAMLAGTFFFLTQFMQKVLGFGPLLAGLAFLPMAGGLFVAAALTTKLVNRLGSKVVVAVGTILVLSAMVWLVTIHPTSGYAASLLAPFVLIGAGLALVLVPLNGVIMSSLPPQHSGAGAGLLQAAQQTGAALGLAGLVTVFGVTVRNQGRESSPGLSATVDGMSNAFVLAAVFVGFALLVVLFLLRNRTQLADNDPLSNK